MSQDYTCATLADSVGREFKSNAPIKISQERVNLFADATGDHQWIHTDVERAKRESPFGGPIAHGFLTLSLLASDVMDAGALPRDAKAALNYGLGKVRFLSAVPCGAEVSVVYKILKVEDKGEGRMLVTFECVLSQIDAPKPAVLAELMAMVIA